MRRNVNTNELRTKYHMAAPLVKEVLKKARVKPLEKTINGKGECFLWPNREANAALRAYREGTPARGRRTKVQMKQPIITNIATQRNTRTLEAVLEEVKALRIDVARILAGQVAGERKAA